jgi:RNA polymerase sigma factor (sigma-70 family)
MPNIEQVIAELGPGLARIASSYERNPALREDLVQEILFAVSRALPRLEDSGKLKPFVFRIAHNRCVDHVVKHAAQPGTKELSPDLPDSDATPEAQLLARETSRRLVEAVRALDLPYRQVMTLLLEDLSYGEIAEALAITPTNVGVRVNRAKAQLKALLTP